MHSQNCNLPYVKFFVEHSGNFNTDMQVNSLLQLKNCSFTAKFKLHIEAGTNCSIVEECLSGM